MPEREIDSELAQTVLKAQKAEKVLTAATTFYYKNSTPRHDVFSKLRLWPPPHRQACITLLKRQDVTAEELCKPDDHGWSAFHYFCAAGDISKYSSATRPSIDPSANPTQHSDCRSLTETVSIHQNRNLVA